MAFSTYRRATPLSIRLFAMRHGPAEHNAARRTASMIEADTHALLPAAAALIQHQASLLQDRGVSIIYTSDFQRAAQTARLVGEVLSAPVVTDERLREIRLGTLDGVREDAPEFFAFSQQWIADPAFHLEGGESQHDVHARLSSFVDEVDRRHAGMTILAVTHSGPIWNLLATLYTLNWPKANAEIGKIATGDILEVYPSIRRVEPHPS